MNQGKTKDGAKAGFEFGHPGKKRNYKLNNMALKPTELAQGMIRKHGAKEALRILTGLARPGLVGADATAANASYEYYLQALNWAKKRTLAKDQ